MVVSAHELCPPDGKGFHPHHGSKHIDCHDPTEIGTYLGKQRTTCTNLTNYAMDQSPYLNSSLRELNIHYHAGNSLSIVNILSLINNITSGLYISSGCTLIISSQPHTCLPHCFPLVCTPKVCVHFSSSPHVPHGLLNASF